MNALATRLASATAHNHATEHAPVAVLRTDGDRKWEPALSSLRARLPNLWTLADYAPANNQGPAAWVQWRLGSMAAGDHAPGIYLPRVRSLPFRSLGDSPEAYKPIAKLPFRGTWWTQQNGKDWTPLAFLTSKNDGLGLSVAENQATVSALERPLVHVLDTDPAELKKPSRLEAEHFVALLSDDLEGDLLEWLDDPDGVRKGCPDDEWTVFHDFVRHRLDVDLDRDGAIVVAERLAGDKFAKAKARQQRLAAILEGGAPLDVFVRWKPRAEEPIGWPPDLGDGVRLKIRSSLTVDDVRLHGAGVLRRTPNVMWGKDRGKNPPASPWTELRDNDVHLTLAQKRAARGEA